MDNHPIGFMSYARFDDAHENGKLTALRERLVGEVRLHSGDTRFEIFQDHIDIAWGEQWQERLDGALDSVKLLIPVITPAFFKSEACRAEVLRFVRREQQLGRNDLILPVYYVHAGVLEDKAKLAEDEIAQIIVRHQHIDWRDLRFEPLHEGAAAKMLAKMAQQIVATIERMTDSAPRVIAPSAVAPANVRPPWACAVGKDEYGQWLEIGVGNVVQRLRKIKAGQFLMGSPASEVGRSGNEGPQHLVRIEKGFWLADTACTQALWQAVMGENPSRFHTANRGGPEHPVERVSWDMVQLFLQASMKKLPDCQLGLPTEAEWEYACRAGSQTAFSFGEQISTSQINFDGNYPVGNGKKGEYRDCTLPVKALPANYWGLYQMHGNVWEWCADGLRQYDGKTVIDPGLADARVPPKWLPRAMRGGSWLDFAQYARSACRYENAPLACVGDLGFRFVLRAGF